MNLQRVKLAWARGARIQTMPYGYTQWMSTSTPDWLGYERIHPEDEHLQYNHLSKALIESVSYDEVEALDTFYAAFELAKGYLPANFLALSEEDGLLLGFFLLFFAEMLADEGL